MKVLGIHGVGHRFRGGPQLHAEWFPALQSGLDESGGPRLAPEDFTALGYGSEFRPEGQRGEFKPSADDLEWEAELQVSLWKEAAVLSEENRSANPDPRGEEPTIQGPDFEGRARTPAIVQRALAQLATTRFFSALGPQRLLVSSLREVRLFLHYPSIKEKILARLRVAVTPETRVIVAHSLGSLVAYEGLCANPGWNVHTLVTIGSPLGIRSLVFDELTPLPANNAGVWPRVRRWVNVSDRGDIVALTKTLAPLFPPPAGCTMVDEIVYNGWESHAATRYLSSKEVGRAVRVALGADAG